MNGDDLPQTFFLGRYRVVDEIGIGGMASVHLARVDGPGGFQKWVAIKRIHPHLVEDDQFVDMFLDEARIAAGINHANVAQVFDLGKDDNTYWIAMEYLHGEPLRELMRRVDEQGGTIPAHIAARICADAAEGLHGAHELRGRNGQLLNLVHRDVTPHNLFVTYEGYTKVVDFGIAKVVDRLASTRAGTLKGKLAYMSPEQVRGQEVCRRTDIFALGVVLWELTTGRRLFRMDTDLDTLEKVQACVVPLPSTIVGNYPPELQDVVMKALSQRKEDRFQTAREFSRALQRFLMKQGTFVGPEDVGDYTKALFQDRVQKREKYLEWAAEVTSAVDIDQLHAQQAQAEGQAPSLLHDAPATGQPGPPQHAPAPQAAPPPQPAPQAHAPAPQYQQQQYQQQHQQHQQQAQPMAGPPPGPPPPNPHQHQAAPLPHQQMRSHGQEAHAAAVVTSAPIHPGGPDLAATSLMDEDEDIPTIVAQPRGPESAPRGPRPAAGMAPAPEWGQSTQLMTEGSGLDPAAGHPGGFDSTIALPDSDAAMGISNEHERRTAQGGGVEYQQLPPGAPQGHGPDHNANQAAIETKMSLPRPAAVAQWLMEQGDVEIGGPRSTGVIIAIAALATLCVMGVASLIVYKLKTKPVPDPTSQIAAPMDGTVAVLPDEREEAFAGSYDDTKKKTASRVAVLTAPPAHLRTTR